MDMNAHSEVELRFSCSNLPNMDVMSKTDAFVVIYLQNLQGILELGRTEVVYDNLNPEFSKGVHLTYHFEEIQTIILKVYDEDKKGIQDLNKHDYIGECAFHLGSLMSSYGQSLSYNLKGPKGGQIRVFAEEIAACNDYLIASFAGHKLKNTDGWFAKSDPFIIIRKIREDNQFVQVWKSEVVMNNLNPQWKPSNIPVQILCNGDYDRPLRVEIYDWDNDGTTTYMGGLQTSLRQILEVGKTKGQFNVIEEKKQQKKKNYQNSGTLEVRAAQIIRIPSFPDYLRGGLKLSLMVGIDFTGSNGRPDSPNSLHYFDPTGQRMNQYEQAIRAIGDILLEYSSDKTFEVFGFGARLPNNSIQHCFPLTFSSDPRVPGVDGVLGCYKNALPQLRLSGPTLFSPILQTALQESRTLQNDSTSHNYKIVLMLTDGVINDMDQTIDAIVQGSEMPLSIIIIGVGNADFSAMETLDGDDRVLQSRVSGKRATRDIVQFVPFNKFSHMHFSALAKETLAEVPAQVTGFYKSKNLMPNPPPSAYDGLSSTQSSSTTTPPPPPPPSNSYQP